MKKYIAALAVLLAVADSSFAQQQPEPPAPALPAPTPVSPDAVFSRVEEMPSFPGGSNALMKFLGENLRYPDSAVAREVEGKVVVQFVVCEDGKLCNEKIVRRLGSGCDEEVLRVVKSMPKWKPGRQNGKYVKTYYTLPVSFRLDYGEEIKSKEPSK